MKGYDSVEDWLGEVEGYSLRSERIPTDALPWVKVAWEMGEKSAETWWDMVFDMAYGFTLGIPVGAIILAIAQLP